MPSMQAALSRGCNSLPGHSRRIFGAIPPVQRLPLDITLQLSRHPILQYRPHDESAALPVRRYNLSNHNDRYDSRLAHTKPACDEFSCLAHFHVAYVQDRQRDLEPHQSPASAFGIVVSQIATSVKELERFARSNYHDPIIELPQTATKQHVKATHFIPPPAGITNPE
jgi:hypothetical protein